MARLIVITGPQAVGKMTVAEALRDALHYNLMINHDSIEVSDRIFGFDTPAQRQFNSEFRRLAFDAAVEHDVSLIFTYVTAFEMDSEKNYLKSLEQLFTAAGGDFYFIELSASLDKRLERNLTPHRMARKASKRDTAWSERNLLSDAQKHRLNSAGDEFWFDHHLKIDNTSMTPEEVAERIISTYGFTPLDRPEKEYRYGI